jgi:hypothetical protein
MLRYFPADRRRRFAPLFLLLGLAVVGKFAYEEVPRETEVRFVMPSPNVEALRVIYSVEGEFYGGLERHFPAGAPEVVGHTPELASGRYDLAIELTGDDGGITRLHRTLELPSDGPASIPLRGER